jgi:PIF1-like helicase
MSHNKNHLTREMSRCRSGNKCIYGFPHAITPETWLDENGRVHYRRRNEDDQWIAPHIPYLIDKFDCHIFVDVVFTVSIFMYLYKCHFKGPDHAYYQIQESNNDSSNEIDDYVRGRYICATEAAWHLFGFHITSKKPSVTCLPIHLPSQNILQYQHKNATPGSTASLLIRYFHRPPLPHFSNLTYTEYYEKYILYDFNNDDGNLSNNEFLEKTIIGAPRKKVTLRRRDKKVTRIQSVSPACGELFYLRCILTHRAISSFEDAMSIGGVRLESFQAVALEMGLFNNSNEGFYTLEEAVSSYTTPAQLRFLFARIIVEGYPARPLWDQFSSDLAADFLLSTHSEELAMDRVLETISEFFSDSSKSLSTYGLPEPRHRPQEIIQEEAAFHGRENELMQQAETMHEQMTDEQKTIFENIVSKIDMHSPHSESTTKMIPLFIEGRPGRGKTFLVDALCAYLRAKKHIVLVCGSSALAATLYERGRTAHKLFGIPVNEVCFFILITITSTNNLCLS